MLDIKDVIRNVENIYGSNNSLKLLKDFERVIDELDCYVFENWIDGEIVEGPEESRYWVKCTLMWPLKEMPDPRAAIRLNDYGCKVTFQQSEVARVRKIEKPDDIRPGTRKGKIDHHEVWLVKIEMPKKLMHDINKGYNALDKNKVKDMLDQSSVVNMQQDAVEAQVQDISNAQPEQQPAQ